MDEGNLRNASLLTWTLQVYKDYKRGLPQSSQEAAVGSAMQHHEEWWRDWEALDNGAGVEDTAITNRLLHIHHDAAVLLQLANKQPPEVAGLYNAMAEKGFTQFECIHALAIGFSEEFADARAQSHDFDLQRYLTRAHNYVKEALARPNMTRTTGIKAY